LKKNPMLAGIVTFFFDIRFNFIIFSLLLFGSFIYAYIVLIETRQRRSTGYMRIKTLALFRDFYNMHQNALTIFLLSLLIYIWIGIEWVFTQLSVQQVFGLHDNLIGFILGGMMAAEVLLYLPGGYFMDKIGKKYVILALLFFLFSHFVCVWNYNKQIKPRVSGTNEY